MAIAYHLDNRRQVLHITSILEERSLMKKMFFSHLLCLIKKKEILGFPSFVLKKIKKNWVIK